MPSIEELLLQAEEMRGAEKLLFQELSANGIVGLELKGRLKYLAIVPEPDGSGRIRLSFFDERGFSGHEVYATEEDALKEAIKQRYIEHCPGALDQLAATETWRLGMVHADLIRMVNSGQITFAQYRAEVANYNGGNL